MEVLTVYYRSSLIRTRHPYIVSYLSSCLERAVRPIFAQVR